MAASIDMQGDVAYGGKEYYIDTFRQVLDVNLNGAYVTGQLLPADGGIRLMS